MARSWSNRQWHDALDYQLEYARLHGEPVSHVFTEKEMEELKASRFFDPMLTLEEAEAGFRASLAEALRTTYEIEAELKGNNR